MFFPYKDDNPRVLIPYVTYSLIAFNTFIFLYQFGTEFSDPESAGIFIYAFGLIPADFFYNYNVYFYVPSWGDRPHHWEYVVSMDLR
tara:strand:- start:775 stop:1035 length:261 start_codon:yes stop_codon:yes gene_type:complete